MLSHIFWHQKVCPFFVISSHHRTLLNQQELYKDNTEITLEGWKIVIRTFSVQIISENTHILCLLYINFLLLRNQKKKIIYISALTQTHYCQGDLCSPSRVSTKFSIFYKFIASNRHTYLCFAIFFGGRKHLLPLHFFC